MGQAKRRGTFEERKAQALARKPSPTNLVREEKVIHPKPKHVTDHQLASLILTTDIMNAFNKK